MYFRFKSLHECNIKRILLSVVLLLICESGYAKHIHSERDYQTHWCKAHNGIIEYRNKDFTRIDCLTAENAVEFDFAQKWAESIGQALHYELMTGKKAKVVLILENPKQEMIYYLRIKNLSKKYSFDVEYMTPDFSVKK